MPASLLRTAKVIIRRAVLIVLVWAGLSTTAFAANCNLATGQGPTGPSDWQTYCWIDFSSYNATLAGSFFGQTFRLTLQDGTVLSFVLTTNGTGVTPVASPSWTGAAIGNTAMTGIGGLPVLYQTGAGTTTLQISAITLTPPAGAGGVTNYMLVAADGESTNTGETLQFVTNGGAWQTLDRAGPVSGSAYPTVTGSGTTTVTESGVDGNVGAYIFGSTKPRAVTTTMVGGGLQGFMLAVRFASVRLSLQIADARVSPADQFNYAIHSTANAANLAAGTSTGTGLGPFNTAGLSATAAVPLTLAETMAAGSASTLAHYQTSLTCTNDTAGSRTTLPKSVITTSYALATLAFGDALQCTFTATPFPHLTLTKALGTGGRQADTDQFVMTIARAGTNVATTTTGGTGSTLTNAATAQTQVTAGTAYTLAEAGSGTTQISQYTATLGCTNSYAASATKLPTTPGEAITPAMGDVVACTLTNTKVVANANLTIVKTSALVSDPVNGTNNPKAIPGAIVAYTLNVANSGPAAVDTNSVLIIDTLPSQLSVGTAAQPTFAQGSPTSALTFNSATDIAFSKDTTAPASFAACTYTPVAAYDPAVRFICINPKGKMAGSTGTPTGFSISINARVN